MLFIPGVLQYLLVSVAGNGLDSADCGARGPACASNQVTVRILDESKLYIRYTQTIQLRDR